MTIIYISIIIPLILLVLFLAKKARFILFLMTVILITITFSLNLQSRKEATSNTSAVEPLIVTDGNKHTLEMVKLQSKTKIDVPLIKQLPELPRGCEVTSLAMLLESANMPVDKMKLAKEVRRNPAKQTIKNGEIHFGDPNNGFVGDMYSFSTPGLGVYHKPIMELAEKYLPGKIINLSDRPFEELKIPLSDGIPVWVIINANYEKLDDSFFQTWHTESGPIQITRKQHSVLITGYDDTYIYFNDPLNRREKALINDFKESWVQMGSHAITYSND